MTNRQVTSKIQEMLRDLPSVDKLLQLPITVELAAKYGSSLITEALRIALMNQRNAILAGQKHSSMPAMLVQTAREWIEDLLVPSLKHVINATGIIVHTNLGRALLSKSAQEAVQAVGSYYSTLEYDLSSGSRGSRTAHAEQLLTRLTESESALVVNNNAAAVLLMLTALCQGKKVIISRGQLVEIGGGFRVPDIMAQSGAELVEVGTTNRTHLEDYISAIDENTAAILVAHHSNFKIIGFTAEPTLAELAELAHEHHIPLLYDQGSGALLDVTEYGLEPEPTVIEGLKAGCDIVAFSGDKLLGGPQAGILCGRSDLIAKLKRHPLARAIRADKMCLAALSATLGHYLTNQEIKEIPVWRMIARPLVEIEAEANAWSTQLQDNGIKAKVVDGRSVVGGGSLPGTSMPTKLVAIEHENVDQLASALREGKIPVIGRIQDNDYLIDPRTVLPDQVELLIASLVNQCQKIG